jgi:uncharacterized membrane protein
MWSLLALLTIGSAPVPPFQLNAICFAIGGTIGLAWTARNGLATLRAVSWRVYAFGTIGLFGYHFLYFTAFRIAPAAETGLIAYLWPLFIVLFSGLLPGERLTARHVLGALIAFAGAALIVLGGGQGGATSALGFALAFACALTWAAYSVLSRRLGASADRKRHGLLPGDGGAVGGRASGAGGNGLAGDRRGVAGGAALGPGPGGRGLLHLGYRDEERRHPAAGCRLVCGAASVDAGAGGRRDRARVADDPGGSRADCRRGRAGCAALKPSAPR